MLTRMIITRNSVKCLKCEDEIESTHRHDFRSCSCGNIMVDGGKEYLRRAGSGISDKSYRDTSVYTEEEYTPDYMTIPKEE